MNITMDEFKARRDKVLEKLAPNSIAILPAASIKQRNSDTEYPFRQNSDFYYLTGFNEADAVLVLSKGAQGQAQEYVHGFTLFCLPKDETAELWTGKRAGMDGAKRLYGADAAYPLAEIDRHLPAMLQNKTKLYYHFAEEQEFDKRLNAWLKQAKQKALASGRATGQKSNSFPEAMVDISAIVHELRLYKSALEVETMRRGAKISADAHTKLMRTVKPGLNERQVEAEFIYQIMQQGCKTVAYTTIVGGGANACTLHYTANDAVLQAGDLVLIDAGGEYNNYAADITRTFPINGKFTVAQAAIYNLVLAAQQQGIKAAQPGQRWSAIQEAIVEVIVAGLRELNILQGTQQQLIKKQAYRRFYMHSSGHWLGLDTHDVGKYRLQGDYRVLELGMVLTVEPGLYFAADDATIDAKWRGIGVRIEDDVLITATGNEVLTAAAPKTIAEIEALMIG